MSRVTPMWTSPARSRGLTLILAALLVALTLYSVSSSAGINWDFGTNYYRNGKILFDGHLEQLYDQDYRIGYTGAPISGYLFAPLGFFEPRPALFVFKVMCAALYAAGLWVLYPIYRRSSEGRIAKHLVLPFYLAAILLFGAFWFTFRPGGQSTPHCFLLLAITYRAYRANRKFPAALALTAAILIKPFLAPALLAFAFALDFGMIVSLIAAFALEFAISILLLGTAIHVAWVDRLTHVTGLSMLVWWNNSAIWNIFDSMWYARATGAIRTVYDLSADTMVNGWSRAILILRLLFVPLLGWAIFRIRRSRALEEDKRQWTLDAGVLFCIGFSLVVWPHYLAFLFPMLMVLGSREGSVRHAAGILAILTILSTLGIVSHGLQNAVLSALEHRPLAQGFAAGFLGSLTTWLALIAFGVYLRGSTFQRSNAL